MTRRGTLVLVVGPSGVGKDTIIAGAAEHLRGGPRIVFARRMITRSADAGGENHLALSEADFVACRDRGEMMLHWEAHGLHYGLPQDLAEALEQGRSVVANVSRAVVTEARRRFPPTLVIAVTASPSVLARRLAARGRETVAQIDRRLERAGAISPEQADFVINNDGLLAAAIDRFVQLLQLAAGPAVEKT